MKSDGEAEEEIFGSIPFHESPNLFCIRSVIEHTG